MELDGKTSVDIIQEMLATLSTRKESAEKLSAVLKNDLSPLIRQTNEFSEDLLEELSEYGDGTSGISDRENAYQSLYKQVLARIDNISDSEARDIFGKMETELVKSYDSFLQTKDSLPESLITILTQQKEQLISSRQ